MDTGLLAIVAPVFGLIAVGFLARLVGLIGDRTGDGLSDFVFALAIPCLIIKTLGQTPAFEVDPTGYWAAYFLGVAIVWTLAMLIALKTFDLPWNESVVAGFAAGQANTVFVGVPLILRAYGNEGAVPLFLLIAIHLPITMTVATVLIEGRGASLLSVARRLATHPILVGIAIAVLVKLLPAGAVPQPVWKIVEMIASAAIPCALIAMGVALRRYGIGENWKMPGAVTVLKLVVHPLAVWLLATKVFSMPPAWAGVAVLFAASPSGINVYLFAERYRTGIGLASSSIAVSTALSLFSTLFWLWFLGVR